MKISFTIILFFTFFFKNFAQTTIGNVRKSDPSAILELDSSEKGFLLTKVSLTNSFDKTTIKNPAIGLLIYNTGNNTHFPFKGFMVWNGKEWKIIVDAPSIQGELMVDSVIATTLIPNAYTSGKPYSGTLEVKYKGGNGGFYSKGDTYTVNGLNYTLQAGKLESGGLLVYTVTGTPNVSYPSPITKVPIKFSGSTLATVSIGGSQDQTVESSQLTLKNDIQIPLDHSAYLGKGGSVMTWYKAGETTSLTNITLQEDGSYSFAFRLYGAASYVDNSIKAAPYYISAWRGTTLLDIVEMTIIRPDGYYNLTYPVNLTISGKKGDNIFFKIAGAQGLTAFIWTLKTGDSNAANRTSMIFWKL